MKKATFLFTLIASVSFVIGQTSSTPAVPGQAAAVPPPAQPIPSSSNPNVTLRQVPGPGAPLYIEVPAESSTTPSQNSVQEQSASKSKVTPAQLQNISRIEVGLNALALPPASATDQRQRLLETLRAAPIAHVRPPSESIGELMNRLETVVPSLDLTAPQRRQLAIDLNMTLNSGNLSREESQRVLADARSLLQGGALNNPEGVNQLIGSLQKIVSQVQSQVAKNGQSSENQPGNESNAVGQGAAAQQGSGKGQSDANSNK